MADRDFEMQETVWHNPTDLPQTVTVHTASGKKKLTWAPKETRKIPSEYNRAIHMVDCGRDECHKTGWFCTKGHEGNIVGGGAPLLVRKDVEEKLDPALDPFLAQKREAEAEMAAQAIVKAAADQALVTAAHKAKAAK